MSGRAWLIYGFTYIIIYLVLSMNSICTRRSKVKKDMKIGQISRSISNMATSSNTSDFNQWLHAMKMVARLPGGMPPEFRRKLWLALAERHLQNKAIQWEKEQEKCMCEQNRDDDEELEIQIVKDLHRTGSSLFSGPAGSLNQAKLKRVLLGYARWNPEVGYCQGFNMLGALILQVMDKNDIESLKVMIFLIEGILPTGYFSGSLGGLQADMAVFREILAARLPRLAKHLQKLQGPMGEGSFEPPLTNVFTMQWFLTLFCTCLPINCVLRVWDLVLIEGSDVLLRTALAIWGLLEERILATKTADDFYCKMGMLSGELLNGHLFDSNGLIQKVVDLGPISELQKMRDKHLYNITPWRDKRGIRLFFTDEEGDSDDDSRLAVTTAWGIRLGRRGSMGMPATSNRPVPDSRDRIALDISLLKKQYDKLRERQRQAHIILTTTARQTVDSTNASSMQVNQYLMGRNAIVSQKGRRIGPPPGAIPPVRKVAALKSAKSSPKPHKRGETLLWKDIDGSQSKRLKEVSVDNKPEQIEQPVMMVEDRNFNITKSPSVTSSISSASDVSVPTSSRSRKKSESSSYSDESDGGNSSTSTSLCDDENQEFSVSSIEASPLRKRISTTTTTTNKSSNDSILNTSQITDCIKTLNEMNTFADNILPMNTIQPPDSKNEHTNDILVEPAVEQLENTTHRLELNRDSGIVNDDEIMFLKVSEEPTVKESDDLVEVAESTENVIECDSRSEINSRTELDSFRNYIFINEHQENVKSTDDCSKYTVKIADVDTEPKALRDLSPQKDTTNFMLTLLPIVSHSSQSSSTPSVIQSQIILKSTLSPIAITSTSQLSPIADISKYLSSSSISPLKTPSSFLDYSEMTTVNSASEAISSVTANSGTEAFNFKVNDEGVTNEYFERITAPERPSRLELRSSISESINTKSSQSDELPSVSGRIISPNHTYVVKSSPPIIQPADPPESEKVTMRCSHPCGSNSSASFMKEKSLSLDEPIMKKHEFRPTSCPEAITENFIQKKSADRVLKIIEENSKILHRILKKTTCNDDVGTFIEQCQLPALSEHFTDSIAAVSTMISEQEALDSEKPMQNKEPTFIRQQTIDDGDISVTLSSIQNTIKSVDSLCQYDESRTKTVELLASIEKLNDSSKEYYDSVEATADPNVSMPINLLTINVQQDEVGTSDARKQAAAAERSPDSKYSLYASRYSRDSRRDVSPRRKRDDDREEYESRFRRDGSMTKSDILPQKRYSDFMELDSGIGSSLNRTSITHEDDFTSTYQGQCKRSYETIERPKVSDSVLYKSYESNLNSTLNDVAYKTTGYGDKFEIRHTTVTSTFYDRFLSQKKERTVKLDKSPSSPVITKAYLDSLRLPIVLDRSSKSAENSPSRPGTMTTITKPVVVSAPSIQEYRSAGSPIISRDTIFSSTNIT